MFVGQVRRIHKLAYKSATRCSMSRFSDSKQNKSWKRGGLQTGHVNVLVFACVCVTGHPFFQRVLKEAERTPPLTRASSHLTILRLGCPGPCNRCRNSGMFSASMPAYAFRRRRRDGRETNASSLPTWYKLGGHIKARAGCQNGKGSVNMQEWGA